MEGLAVPNTPPLSSGTLSRYAFWFPFATSPVLIVRWTIHHCQGLKPGEELAPGLAFHTRPDLSLPRSGPGENGSALVLEGKEAAAGRVSLAERGMNLVARLGSLA